MNVGRVSLWEHNGNFKMAGSESPVFKVGSTLNTDHASGTALRIFPAEVYAHSTPDEHELFTIIPPRNHDGLVDRDGFLIMTPKNTVGRIPLETRNGKENWKSPRLRKNPGQIPYRDPFIQEFPVKTLGARNKRWHDATIQGDLVRIQDLYVGIYSEETLAKGRSPWPTAAEVQAVMKRERRASRRTTITTKAREQGIDTLDYLTKNVEQYLETQGYDLASGSAPSALALAIAIKAKIEGAEEPEEGADALAQINDDWIDDADLVRLTSASLGPGYVAIGTQKSWNGRRGAWEYMITGHLSYDVLDVVGRDKPYVHPFGLEGRNRRADAGLHLVEDNSQRRNHLLSGHPKNPLLDPKPIMRFSFHAEEWSIKPTDIPEHRPRIITPYTVEDASEGVLIIPEVRMYLRTGELPADAFVARRRHHAPPAETRASKPRPEGLKTFRPDGVDGSEVDPGLTLDDLIDEPGIDQIVSGAIAPRPLVVAAEPAAPHEDHGESTGSTTEDVEIPEPPRDFKSFDDLEAYLLSRTNAEASRPEETQTTTHSANADESQQNPTDDTATTSPSPEDAEPEIQEPVTAEGGSSDPRPYQRPVIEKSIGHRGRVQFGVGQGPQPNHTPKPYPAGHLLRAIDAFLDQRHEQMRHIAPSNDVKRVAAFAEKTHWQCLVLLEPLDDVSEVPQAQTIKDILARLTLSGQANPAGYALHWLRTIQTVRDLIAPLMR